MKKTCLKLAEKLDALLKATEMPLNIKWLSFSKFTISNTLITNIQNLINAFIRPKKKWFFFTRSKPCISWRWWASWARSEACWSCSWTTSSRSPHWSCSQSFSPKTYTTIKQTTNNRSKRKIIQNLITKKKAPIDSKYLDEDLEVHVLGFSGRCASSSCSCRRRWDRYPAIRTLWFWSKR